MVFSAVTIGTIVGLTVSASLGGARIRARWLDRWGNAFSAAVLVAIGVFVLALLIVYEAIHRLVSPPHVRAGLILAVALIGAAVNVAATLTLAGADRRSINLEGSFQHILTDLYAFSAAVLVAIGVFVLAGG